MTGKALQSRRAASLLAIALSVGLAACSSGSSGGNGYSASTSAPSATIATPQSSTLTRTPGTPVPIASPPPASNVASLSVDTNRTGQVTHDPNRGTWTSAAGAVFAWNNYNAASQVPASAAWADVQTILDSAASVINAPTDQTTMGQIVASQLVGITPTAITLSVTPATAPVQIFMADASGNYTVFIAPGAGSGSVPVASLTAGNVSFLIEGTGPRSATWDGTVAVTLDVQGPGIQDSKDTCALREAPIIYTDNTRPALTVYAMNITDPQGSPNQPFWTVLSAGLQAQNVPLVAVDQNAYGFDRWVQDNMQTAYQGYASVNGPTYIDEFNQLERGAGAGNTPASQLQPDMWSYIPLQLLSPTGGMTYAGPSQSQDSPNYGGNFEVLPPYGDPNYPFGRFMHGGGDTGTVDGTQVSRHMNPEEVALVEAQGMQSPGLELSSEWLAVGHLDEMLMAVPDLSANPTHPFKILWASPALAIQALTQLKTAGLGTATVFTGEQEQTTVNAILGDANLMTYNDQAQARLDSDRAALEQITGLTDADFIQLPVFYEIAQGNPTGFNYAISENPGVQNCIPVNNTLYMPDPEGPLSAGQDVWKQQILTALQPTGLTVAWVNVFTSYHELMGEAHCGSNVIYQPYDAPWWTK